MASQQTQQHGPTNILELVLSWVGQVFIFLGDLLFLPLQRWFGVRSMAYVFVLPNLVIFGVFILFPMLLNFNYAMSGGGNLFPQERPFVGMTNFAELFNCDNFFAPNTCSQDRFARASINTIFYVLFQVAFMVLAAVITAMELN